MKDNSTELQTAYYDLLNGNISYSGTTIPLHDTVPADTTYPYMQFGGKTSNDDSNKSQFGSEDSLLISIVDRFNSGVQGTRKRINSVANDLFGLLKPSKGEIGLSLTNFTVIRCIVENDLSLRELDDTHLYLRREIRFNHKLREI